MEWLQDRGGAQTLPCSPKVSLSALSLSLLICLSLGGLSVCNSIVPHLGISGYYLISFQTSALPPLPPHVSRSIASPIASEKAFHFSAPLCESVCVGSRSISSCHGIMRWGAWLFRFLQFPPFNISPLCPAAWPLPKDLPRGLFLPVWSPPPASLSSVFSKRSLLQAAKSAKGLGPPGPPPHPSPITWEKAKAKTTSRASPGRGWGIAEPGEGKGRNHFILSPVVCSMVPSRLKALLCSAPSRHGRSEKGGDLTNRKADDINAAQPGCEVLCWRVSTWECSLDWHLMVPVCPVSWGTSMKPFMASQGDPSLGST